MCPNDRSLDSCVRHKSLLEAGGRASVHTAVKTSLVFAVGEETAAQAIVGSVYLGVLQPQKVKVSGDERISRKQDK